MTDINTGGAVLVIGDTDTADRTEMLAEKAAEKGVQIAQTFAFDPGAAASHDDLTEVDEVVAALSRAIVTRTDLWCPFPLQDLCREQHFRRLSLALQRHGLNLLMGPDLAPCPTEGGYHEVDAALRKEVHAVDDLDHAALASAGLRTLGAEIEASLAGAPGPSDRFGCDADFFSTAEAARFFGKSADWLSRGLREGVFTNPDGASIEPLRVGRAGRLRFTLPVLRDIAHSCHRRGILSRRRRDGVLAALSDAESATDDVAPTRNKTRRPAMTSTRTITPTWEHDDLVHGWWVIPGRLLAVEYPGAKEPDKAARKIQTLLDAGIDSFVNLTEDGEKTWGGAPMVPYDRGLAARHARFPIPDTSVIGDAGYDEILGYIRDEIAAGRVVYVHCWGGKGRTGTVVGAWLIAEEGLGYPEVLERMQELRAGSRKAGQSVPDTREQADVLRRRARRAEHRHD